MASNFDLIGFKSGSDEELSAVVDNPRFQPNRADFGGVEYLSVKDGDGAELWLGSASGNIITANPMFDLGHCVSATIDHVEETTHGTETVESTLNLTIFENDEPVTQTQCLAVNVPQVVPNRTKLIADVMNGRKISISLAVFSHETAFFATEEDFLQTPADLTIDAKSFVPSGLLVKEDEPTSPVGFGAGLVQSCGVARNTFGGVPYNWAVVETLGGVFTVVWSPFDCTEAAVGGILRFDGMIIAKAQSPFWALD